MTISTAYAQTTSANDAVNQIKEQMGSVTPKLVLFFASASYKVEDISTAMKDAFGDAQVIGCSTSGELVSGLVLKQSITAMALDSNAIEDISVAVVENCGTANNVPAALQEIEEYYGTPMLEMDISQYVGLILIDGLSGAEERVMEKIGDLTDVLFIGGSAGDDLKFEATFVCANGKTYSNAAVLALCKTTRGYDVLKTQSFCSLNKKLVATKVDEASRTVAEFNEKPAIAAYAEALGTTIEEAADRFMSNPVGLIINDEPFVRSPQQVQDQKMVFYCNIKQGMEMELLESQNIVKDTQEALKQKLNGIGSVAGIINFHCILRTLELEQKGQTEEYGQIFADIPTVGFSTYGEEYLGHINQTSTMLLIK